MATHQRSVITAKQVTSLRLKPALKERLWETSGEHRCQTCIQAVLWQFAEQRTGAGGA